MAGVINIITKKPKEGIHANLGLTTGSYGVIGGSGNASGRKIENNRGYYFDINTGYRQGDGYIIEPLETRDSNHVKSYLKEYNTRELLGYQINNNHKIEAEHIYYLGKHGNGKEVYEKEGSFDEYTINLFTIKYLATAGKLNIRFNLFTNRKIMIIYVKV